MDIFTSAKEKLNGVKEKITGKINKNDDDQISETSDGEIENDKKTEQEILDSLQKEKQLVLDLPMYEGEWHSQSNIEKNESAKILDIMRKNPLFHDIKDRQLKKLIPLFYTRHFAANEYLFRQGNPGSCMFIIKNGQVNIQTVSVRNVKGKVIDKETTVYSKLTNGQMFGEMSLINKTTRSTDALCITDTDVFVLFKYDLEDLFRKEPELGFAIYTRINETTAQRLASTNSKLVVSEIENYKLTSYINRIYEIQKANPDEKIKLLSKDEIMNLSTFLEK